MILETVYLLMQTFLVGGGGGGEGAQPTGLTVTIQIYLQAQEQLFQDLGLQTNFLYCSPRLFFKQVGK